MATSTNYGWAEPDDSSLVKNGAADIRTLGNAIDTSLWNAGYGQAGKNGLINGAMEVAQRGTAAVTLNAAAFSYPVDRWFACRNSGTTGATAQQISSIGLTRFNNALRIQRTAGDTSTTRLYMGQSFETINSIPFAGLSVTLSFYARKGADLSSNLAVRLFTGTGTDQSGLGSAWTGTATPISQSQALTTTWTRYQFTATLATTATQIQAFFFIDPTGTAGAADYFDITGVQVEVGAIATPFRRSAGNYQGELAACQRYYYRAGGDTVYQIFASGWAATTNTAYVTMNMPVTMRVIPAALDYSTLTINDLVVATNTVTNLTLTGGYLGKNTASLTATVAAGLVAKNACNLTANNSTSGYVGLSAELQEMTMDKVSFIEVENPDGTTTEHAIIDRGNGEFTSMPKATYDELKANEAETI